MSYIQWESKDTQWSPN